MSIISVTTYGSDPQTVNAANLNALVTPIISDYNGNIDNTNIATGAGIANSKLNLASIAQAVTHSGGVTLTTTNQTMTLVAIDEAEGASIASATTPNLTTATGNTVHITGTTTITGFVTGQAGMRRILIFDGILTFTHNSTSLILPTGANITTAAGDTATMVSEGSGNWRCTSFQRKDGSALVGTTPTVANALSGSIVQMVNVETGASSTGTTVLPRDNTIPQITEGDQYMSLAITPNNASNTLIIVVSAIASTSSGGFMTTALFQDSTANALAAVPNYGSDGTDRAYAFNFTHKMAAGTTSATTFRVRIGGNGAGTTTFNGEAGSRLLGGVCSSSISIYEVKA